MQQVSCAQHLGIKKPELINSQVAQLLDPTPINFRAVQLVTVPTDRPTDRSTDPPTHRQPNHNPESKQLEN